MISDDIREALVEYEHDDGPLTWAHDEEDGLEHATRGSFDATIFDAGFGLRLQIEIDVRSYEEGRILSERLLSVIQGFGDPDDRGPVVTGPVKKIPRRVSEERTREE